MPLLAALLALVLTTLISQQTACPNVVIDVGGPHQAAVVGIFQQYAPNLPVTAITANWSAEIAADLAAVIGCGAKVVNLSLSVACDCADVRAAVEQAIAADVLIVAASGNDGPDVPTTYPAAYPGVLSVGATQTPSNPSRISAAAYTSFAAPVVAGTAARMRQINPALSAEATTAILLQTAKNGVVDPFAAYAVAAGYRVFVPVSGPL